MPITEPEEKSKSIPEQIEDVLKELGEIKSMLQNQKQEQPQVKDIVISLVTLSGSYRINIDRDFIINIERDTTKAKSFLVNVTRQNAATSLLVSTRKETFAIASFTEVKHAKQFNEILSVKLNEQLASFFVLDDKRPYGLISMIETEKRLLADEESEAVVGEE